MIQSPQSLAVYQKKVFDALLQTGVQQTSPGGKARAFADIVASVVAESEARQFLNLSQSLLPFATGDSLDFIGEIYGVRRLSRQDGSVSVLDDNFQFYVRTGTFGSINQGQDIIVPAGTLISTLSNTGPVYSTRFNVTLPAAASVFSFAATSQLTGSQGNAPAKSFARHNFSNYADSVFGSLLVTNNFGVVAGRDVEDDEAYRFRIHLQLLSTGGAAEGNLRSALLTIPGIQDIVFRPLAGTFEVYVYGISPVVPPSLLGAVQTQIDLKAAYPLKGTALAPDLVGISLATTVTTITGLSQSDKDATLVKAAQAAADYINNLSVGQPIILNEIADRLNNADVNIIDIGDPNQPLQQIFVWRSRLDGTRYSRFLVTNYTPQIGERIVVEDITNAIALVAV